VVCTLFPQNNMQKNYLTVSLQEHIKVESTSTTMQSSESAEHTSDPFSSFWNVDV